MHQNKHNNMKASSAPSLIFMPLKLPESIAILAAPTTAIVNLSLTERSFPSHLKNAYVSPLFEKSHTWQRQHEKSQFPFEGS